MLNPPEIAAATASALFGSILLVCVVSVVIHLVRRKRGDLDGRKPVTRSLRWLDWIRFRAPADRQIHISNGFDYDVERAGKTVSSSSNKNTYTRSKGTTSPNHRADPESPKSDMSNSSSRYLLPSKPIGALKPPLRLFKPQPSPPIRKEIISEGIYARCPSMKAPISKFTSFGDRSDTSSNLKSPPRVYKTIPSRLCISNGHLSPPPIVISPPLNSQKPPASNNRWDGTGEGSASQAPLRVPTIASRNFLCFSTSQTKRKPAAIELSRIQKSSLEKNLPSPPKNSSCQSTPNYIPEYYMDPTPTPIYLPASTPKPMSPSSTFNNKTPQQTVAKGNQNGKNDVSETCSETGTDFDSDTDDCADTVEDDCPFPSPLRVKSLSPLKDIRYPKVPRPSNQFLAKEQPLKHSPSLRREPKDLRPESGTTINTRVTNRASSFLETRRVEQAALELELSSLVATGDQNLPSMQASSNKYKESCARPKLSHCPSVTRKRL